MTWLTWWFPARRAMSAGWIAQINKPSSRIEFHGVAFKWPIRKVKDQHALWNTNKLRKSA